MVYSCKLTLILFLHFHIKQIIIIIFSNVRQITDIHISILRDPGRVKDFNEFCSKTLDAIQPTVVVASGDLTDAAREYLRSGQNEEEWRIYHDIVIKNKVAEKTLWLDIRGNHDNFNVPGQNDTTNYYTKYSIQGKNNPRSYITHVSVLILKNFDIRRDDL